MFAKVFGQIFDSSIAEDYNCRRMFMDLLVLADQTGAVDMTYEAISRRTNVPVEEVVKYVKELCQPDQKSRSKLEEGKRLIPLDSNRDWGWKIVNYVHYRKIRDEAARREYFRDKQREHRKKVKKAVKDAVLTELNESGQVLTSASASSCTVLKEGVRGRFEEWMKVRRSMGKAPKDWDKMFSEQIKWISQFSVSDQLEIISASIRNNWQGLFEPKQSRIRQTSSTRGKLPAPVYPQLSEKRQPTDDEISASKQIANEHVSKLREQFKHKDEQFTH